MAPSFRRRNRLGRASGVVLLLLAAGVAAWGLWRRAAAPPQTAQLAIVSDLLGVTAPCGCTSRPLGGVDRAAGLIERARQTGPLALFALGNTFFDPPPHLVPLRSHRVAVADALGSWLQTLAFDGCAIGPADVQGAWHQTPPFSLVAGCASPPQAPLLGARLHRLGEHRVGVLTLNARAWTGPQDASVLGEADVAHAAHQLREQGADGVLLLWPFGAQNASRALDAKCLDGVDVVVSGQDGPPLAPQRLGEAMLVCAGGRGEHVGFLQLRRKRDAAHRRWQWDDHGESQKRPLQERRARFAQEAAALPAGPARQARQARIDALDTQLASIVAPPIDGTAVHWRLAPVEASEVPAPWAERLLRKMNDSLCDAAMAETGQRTCAPAPDAASAYVGTAACVACHAEAAAVWEGTAHAHAWATLKNAHKACDLSCVGCHVVGWEQPGGFCHLAEHAPWQNVGCESCHGPGAGHVAHPTERAQWAKSFVRDTPEATCRGCHNPEHSDQFDFSRYRPRVLGPGHGALLAPAL